MFFRTLLRKSRDAESVLKISKSRNELRPAVIAAMIFSMKLCTLDLQDAKYL